MIGGLRLPNVILGVTEKYNPGLGRTRRGFCESRWPGRNNAKGYEMPKATESAVRYAGVGIPDAVPTFHAKFFADVEVRRWYEE